MPLPVHIPDSTELLPLLVGLIGVYNFYQVVPYAHRTDRELFRAFEGHALNSGALSDSYLYHGFSENPYPYGVQWIMFCVLLALNVIVLCATGSRKSITFISEFT